jgi:hypothetical protein
MPSPPNGHHGGWLEEGGLNEAFWHPREARTGEALHPQRTGVYKRAL